MATIPLTGTGGLMTRIGVLGGLASAVNAFRGTDAPFHVGEIQQQYVSTNQDVIDNLYSYLLAYQNSGSGIMGNIKTLAASTVQEMAADAQPLPNSQTSTALQLLIAQMQADGQSVNKCTVSSSMSPYVTNFGNAVCISSSKDVFGNDTEYQFSENCTATVTSDYQSSTSLIGVEPISLVAPASVSDTFSWLYPAGSGVTLSFSAVSALRNGGSGNGNWLNNGAMEAYTVSANLPDFWHLGTGTPGTTILQSTAVFYDGSSSISFVGNGSENTSIHQSFSIAGTAYDTGATMFPFGQFAVNFAVKLSTGAASGVLQVSLANASGVTTDSAGNQNSISINLTSLTNSWTQHQAVFRTPNPLPAPPMYLRFAMTTPIPSGCTLYIDHVAFTQMNRLYAGGPSVAIFSGNANLVRGDSFAAQFSNLYDGKMQYLFDKLFNMKQLGLRIPSSTSPTIPDSLIQ